MEPLESILESLEDGCENNVEFLREHMEETNKAIDDTELQLEQKYDELTDHTDPEYKKELASEISGLEYDLGQLGVRLETLAQKKEELEDMGQLQKPKIETFVENTFIKLKSLLKEKMEGYGPLGVPELAPNVSILDSILVRLSDKIRRLRNSVKIDLHNREVRKTGIGEILEYTESPHDTLMDMAGYSLLHEAYYFFLAEIECLEKMERTQKEWNLNKKIMGSMNERTKG